MAVGSSDLTTTPLFFIIAVSWNETFDQSDYPDYPRLPQNTPELYRTTEHYALCRFPWTRLQQVLPQPCRRRPFPSPAPQQLPMRMLPSLMPGRPRRRRSPGGHALRKVWPCLCAMPLLHRSFFRLQWAPRSTTTAASRNGRRRHVLDGERHALARPQWLWQGAR